MLRPIISIDGTHLRGKYPTQLLTTTAIDGNNGLFPLAYAVVESENKDSWEWVLQIIGKHVIGFEKKFVLISNRQKGLMEAVSKVFSNVFHSFCVKHLTKNYYTKFKDEVGRRKIWNIARLYTIQDFERAMYFLAKDHLDCHKWLKAINPRHWATAYFPGKRYIMLTTNISESTNVVLNDARALPIIHLIETVREKVTKYFYQTRINGETMKSIVTPFVEKHLEAVSEDARYFDVFPFSLHIFRVKTTS